MIFNVRNEFAQLKTKRKNYNHNRIKKMVTSGYVKINDHSLLRFDLKRINAGGKVNTNFSGQI